MELKELSESIEESIKQTYEAGVSLENAEKLAAKTLAAMMAVSRELKSASLDAKMKKSGFKAIRAAVRLEEVRKSDKKPTESTLDAIIDSNDMVSGEEARMYEAEETRDELNRYYDIFKEAHIYYRGISKGRFE